jgi:hypothetical protein
MAFASGENMNNLTDGKQFAKQNAERREGLQIFRIDLHY